MTGMQKTETGSEWRKGWLLVAAATAGMSLSAVPIYSLGVMIAPIQQELGWSRTGISFGLTLVSAISVTSTWFFGNLSDRTGPRKLAVPAAILMCASLALFSAVQSNIWFWWSIWALTGIAGSMGTTVWALAVSSRFEQGRGLALGITLSGSGLAATLVPILGGAYLVAYGWRGAYLAIAGTWSLVALPLILLFFRGAQELGAARKSSEKAPKPLVGLTARESFRSLKYYRLLAAVLAMMLASSTIVVNVVPIVQSRGIALEVAAALASILGIATISGRLIGGALLDRFNAGTIAASASCLGASFAALLLLFPGSAIATGAGIMITGVCGGAQYGSVVYLVSSHFGTRSFGMLFGVIGSLIGMCAGLGPTLASYLYDRTQSYEPVLWMALPLSAIAAIFFLSLGRYPDFTRETPDSQGGF